MTDVRTGEVGFEHQLTDVVERLDEHGYAIVERVLDPADTARIAAELRRLLDAVPTGRNFFEGFRTRRLYALFAKTRLLDPLALRVLEGDFLEGDTVVVDSRAGGLAFEKREAVNA